MVGIFIASGLLQRLFHSSEDLPAWYAQRRGQPQEIADVRTLDAALDETNECPVKARL
jgi:hypothetical protein